MVMPRPGQRTAGGKLTRETKQHQEQKARNEMMAPWNNSTSVQSPVFNKIREITGHEDHLEPGRAKLPNMMTLYGALTLELPQHTPRLSGLVGEGA